MVRKELSETEIAEQYDNSTATFTQEQKRVLGSELYDTKV